MYRTPRPAAGLPATVPDRHFIIDFDSTLTRVEALDELAHISLKHHPERSRLIAEIARITALAMDGKTPFDVALDKRIALLHAHRTHLSRLIRVLAKKISASIRRNRQFFVEYHDQIFVVSGGFKDFIVPVVGTLGIDADQVFANTFVFDKKGYIVGYDKSNPLSKPGGKVELLKSLHLKGDVYVIGDGYTDYQLREAGLANRFYAFTENVERDSVTRNADHVAPSLDEVLYVNKLPAAVSYPKNRIKALLLENIHAKGVRKFKDEGYQVDALARSLSPSELRDKVAEVHVLGIRSKTRVTEADIMAARRLMCVGTFCVGTDQVDLDAATRQGIPVFNAPFSNTRSVVELAVGAMITLMRRVPEKNRLLHAGTWDKSAQGSREIRGKKLGIVGYGKIGSQLGVLAEALGMDVLYYDVADQLALGNAKPCRTLDELLRKADVVSVHVDGRDENRGLCGKKQFRHMKAGSLFLNMSRGFVVDVGALAVSITSGRLAGAAVDVFPEEPAGPAERFVSVLQNLPNVILTPHLGGSTEEAQENIGEYVPERIIEFVNTGSTMGSVNFPNVQLPRLANAHRLLHVHRNVPGILAAINSVFAKHNINVLGQYLKTNELVGYVITDVARNYDPEVIQNLRHVPSTIKFRVLY